MRNGSWNINRKKPSQTKSKPNNVNRKKCALPKDTIQRDAVIFTIVFILVGRFQSITSNITKSIATLILSKHEFYWYFNPINYITSISLSFSAPSAVHIVAASISVQKKQQLKNERKSNQKKCSLHIPSGRNSLYRQVRFCHSGFHFQDFLHSFLCIKKIAVWESQHKVLNFNGTEW